MNARRLLAVAPLQIAQALIGFGVIAAFTRLMSPEEFGRYALALSASMAAHTLLFTWAEAAAFRFFSAARAERRLRDHYATLLALVVGLGAAVLVATAGLLWLIGFDNEIGALSAFAAAAAVFRFLTRITRESERAALALGRFAALETAYVVLGFAAGVAFLLVSDFGAAAPFAGLLVAGVAIAILDAPRLIARARGGVASPERAFVYVSYGAPLALALAVDLVVQTLARFIVAHQAGAAELGGYAAAFGLARPLDLIFMSVGAALSPLLLAAHEGQGADAVRETARKGFALLAALALPAAIGLALIAQPIAELMLGAGLRASAAAALPWLVLAGLAAGFNLYFFSEAFQLKRRTGLRALIMLAPGLVQIVLTIVLAPRYGAAGAGAAAAAGALIGGVLLAGVGRTLIAMPIAWGGLARAGAASAAMAAITLTMPRIEGVLGLGLLVATGASAYCGGAIVFDVMGVRARASAVLQRLYRRLRDLIHPSFTDRAHVRPPW